MERNNDNITKKGKKKTFLGNVFFAQKAKYSVFTKRMQFLTPFEENVLCLIIVLRHKSRVYIKTVYTDNFLVGIALQYNKTKYW